MFHFIFPEVHQKKYHIGEAHGKCQKFHDYLTAGIQQCGKFRCGVIEKVVDQRHSAQNTQLPVGLGKKKRRGLTEVPAQEEEYAQRHQNPAQVVEHFRTGQGQKQDTDPVAELTAQIGSQNRYERRQPAELIVENQHQQQREMYQQRVNGICVSLTQQKSAGDIEQQANQSYRQEQQDIFPLLFYAQEKGLQKDAEQHGGNVMRKCQSLKQHDGNPPVYG